MTRNRHIAEPMRSIVNKLARPADGQKELVAGLVAALQEAIEFQNDDTECLVGNQADNSFDEPGDEPCPDRRCHDHGCMVARVNSWRSALSKAQS